MDLFTFEKNVDLTEPTFVERIEDPAEAKAAGNAVRPKVSSLQPSLTLSQSARAVMRLPTSPSQAINDAMASLVANVRELGCLGALRISYSRDNDHYLPLSRYAPEFYQLRTMIEAVDILEQDGIVEHDRTMPPNAAHRSQLQWTDKLDRLVKDENGLPWAYVPHEVIVLRGADGKPQPYCDTTATNEMRRDVLAHNAFLSTFSITVKHPDAVYVDRVLMIETTAGDRYINPTRRDYYRVFNGSLDRGGRWYGPWWHLLPSRVRKGIRINGEKTCELNIRVCQLRLLCARDGLPPWNTGYGLWLQDVDAEVCARVQARLRADGIPCLSMHNSFIVPRSAHDRTNAVMNEEFERACARLRAEG